MSVKTHRTDILIIGGGVAGLTLATLLGAQGMDIHLVEPFAPPPVKDVEANGRTVALMNNSINIIQATHIWGKISTLTCPIETMRVVEGYTEKSNPQDFSAHDIDQDQFGFNIPNDILRAALYERAQNIKTIHIHDGEALSTLEHTQDSLTATLESGAKVTANLLVGADGRASHVRKLLGIKTKETPYEQSAITCMINHSKAHQNVSTEFHYPAGPLALVPLPGNQSSIVWVEKTERADELIKLKKSDFEAALNTATRDCLGGITLETSLQSWPLRAVQAERLIGPRSALIAEAAHVMSPITAQGLNLSLRDVATLAEEIIDAARLGLDVGGHSLLHQYEKRRRLDIKTRGFGVDNMNRLVSNDHPALQSLRRAGFKALSSMPPLKRFATQHALAPTIDQSRLAKGQAL